MKKGIIGIVLAVFILPIVSAACVLDVDMINQDPYPATPGDYVDVVFQVNGVQNPDCGIVVFEVMEEFPFSLDPGVDARTQIRAGTYSKDFGSFLIVPHKLRVDEDALDGNSPVEISYSTGLVSDPVSIDKEFNINIQDSRTDFEVSIKDYQSRTNTLIFDILNIGENDIEALTIEIPRQDNLVIKGTNRNIVGSLDSNEDTTFSFEAIPSAGEINLKIHYTDQVNVRRSVEKTITYEPEYFSGRIRDQTSTPTSYYVIGIVVIVIIIWWIRRTLKKRRKEKERHHLLHGHPEDKKKKK